MANKRISELPVGSLNEQSIIPIATNGVTSKPLLVVYYWQYQYLVVVLLVERHASQIV
jgi:hypothetical protein